MSAAETFEQPGESASTEASAATVERTFVVGEPARLVIQNPRGRVRITAWERPEIQIRARKLPDRWNGFRDDTTRIEIESEGSTVIARTLLPGTTLFRNGKIWNQLFAEGLRALEDLIRARMLPAEVVYEIQVPRRTDVEAAGVTCSFEIAQVQGTVGVRGVSGPVTFRGLAGPISVATVSGPVDGSGLNGAIELKSVSGPIRLEGRLDSLRLASVSGSIELFGPLAPAGRYALKTVSGNVIMRLPTGVGASIAARGVSLEVSTEHPVEVVRDRRSPGMHEWVGRLNQGGASVSFRTVSGHLVLAMAPPSAGAPGEPARSTTPSPEAPAPPADQVTPETPAAAAAPSPGVEPDAAPESAQLRILRALERGEIAVDEALRQLDALRRPDDAPRE